MRKDRARAEFTMGLPPGAAVLDVGCWSYSFERYSASLGRSDLRHAGVDREVPPGDPPDGYRFCLADLDEAALPFSNQEFDGVVLSHIIEHLRDPLKLMDEVFRVLKPGGLCYIECPSDRSARFPSMPFAWHEFRSLNFYDDPTHLGRPQTPQSLYRMLSMYGAEVLDCGYLTWRRVRLLLPWYLLRSYIQRDAATLEHTIWWGFGFAVCATARKPAEATRGYVVSG